MKKMTVETAVTAYNALKEGKVTRMESGEKISVVKAVRALKPTATGLADFVEEAREKMKPEGWEEIEKKTENFKNLPEEERVAVNKEIVAYNEAVDKCVKEELSREVEVDFQPIGEEAFGRLIDSNDFTLNVITTLQEALC